MKLLAAAALSTALLAIPNRAPEEVEPAFVLTGNRSAIVEEVFHRVRDEESWKALWKEHVGESRAREGAEADRLRRPQVDFERFEIVALFDGKGPNCRGLEVDEIVPGETPTIRMRWLSYQTMNGVDRNRRPYGFVVVERTEGALRVEVDRRAMGATEPKWVELVRWS